MENEGVKTLTIASDKGGVGKSTLVALIIEYLNFKNIPINLKDADPIQTSQRWVNNCLKDGRNVLSDKAKYLIIDTAGTSGANTTYLDDAHIIIVPFQPHYADITTILRWFRFVRPEIQKKVVFVPNRYQKTNEQKDGLLSVQKQIEKIGAGFLLSYISNRPAIYGALLNGGNTNFFVKHSDESVLNEIKNLMNYILEK